MPALFSTTTEALPPLSDPHLRENQQQLTVTGKPSVTPIQQIPPVGVCSQHGRSQSTGGGPSIEILPHSLLPQLREREPQRQQDTWNLARGTDAKYPEQNVGVADSSSFPAPPAEGPEHFRQVVPQPTTPLQGSPLFLGSPVREMDSISLQNQQPKRDTPQSTEVHGGVNQSFSTEINEPQESRSPVSPHDSLPTLGEASSTKTCPTNAMARVEGVGNFPESTHLTDAKKIREDDVTHANGGDTSSHGTTHVTTHVQEKDLFKWSQESDFEKGAIATCEQVESSLASSATDAFQTGAVPGFSTGRPLAKRPVEAERPPSKRSKSASVEPREVCHDEETPNTSLPVSDLECVLSPTAVPGQLEVFIISDDSLPRPFWVTSGSTMGQLAVAFGKYVQQTEPGTHVSVTTAVGSFLPLSSPVYAGAIVKIMKLDTEQKYQCKAHLPDVAQVVPSFGKCTREQMLWQQQGFVAIDEMDFYVRSCEAYPIIIHEPLQLTDETDSRIQLCQFLLNMMRSAVQKGMPSAVPILYQGHWFPVGVSSTQTRPTLLTTPMQAAALRQWLIEGFGSDQIDIQAWKDLKARASMCTPPIRIVHSDELQELIKQKVIDGKPVGRKQNKTKHKSTAPELRLKAEQISVPPSVFRQQNGEELTQIEMSQVGSTSKGIIIANITEAVPYFALRAPISSEGVGLLVLDHADPRIPDDATFIKVPALCNITKEPLITTAALIQLGQQQVMRNLPTECIEVHETPHVVVRAAIYRDQVPGSWEDFCKKPVRMMLDMKPFQDIPSQDILDIWDRQFLNEALRKEDPKTASIFMVNARIHKDHAANLVKQSGFQGCFFELRSKDGRRPHESQQVIWLPKQSFAEASVALQTNRSPCTLARSGNRYGLRVDHEHAESTHFQHRPEVIFLQGQLRKFKVGPLPFGSSKASIAALFRKWSWQARPLSPAGPARDKSGMTWIVQSAENPANWIYQVSHGDVLISPLEPESVQNPVQPAVIASDRTIQTLQKMDQPKAAAASSDSTDPWQHYDPWKKQHPPELPPHQFAMLKSALEKQVIPKQRTEDDKMQTDVDHRVSELEEKFDQLSCSVTAFQQAQSQQNQTTSMQLQALDSKVDMQHQSLSSMLDAKLQGQMEKIEQLFTKRPRHE
eukprot:s4170_g2.t1